MNRISSSLQNFQADIAQHVIRMNPLLERHLDSVPALEIISQAMERFNQITKEHVKEQCLLMMELPVARPVLPSESSSSSTSVAPFPVVRSKIHRPVPSSASVPPMSVSELSSVSITSVPGTSQQLSFLPTSTSSGSRSLRLPRLVICNVIKGTDISVLLGALRSENRALFRDPTCVNAVGLFGFAWNDFQTNFIVEMPGPIRLKVPESASVSLFVSPHVIVIFKTKTLLYGFRK